MLLSKKKKALILIHAFLSSSLQSLEFFVYTIYMIFMNYEPVQFSNNDHDNNKNNGRPFIFWKNKAERMTKKK